MPRWTSSENKQFRIETELAVEKQEAERRADFIQQRNYRDTHPRVESEFDSARRAREEGVR